MPALRAREPRRRCFRLRTPPIGEPLRTPSRAQMQCPGREISFADGASFVRQAVFGVCELWGRNWPRMFVTHTLPAAQSSSAILPPNSEYFLRDVFDRYLLLSSRVKIIARSAFMLLACCRFLFRSGTAWAPFSDTRHANKLYAFRAAAAWPVSCLPGSLISGGFLDV